ncbi:MAG: hypothetical protein AABZ60_05060 [Planctomycetota bacterium]
MDNENQWQDPLENPNSVPEPFLEKTPANFEKIDSGHLISWLVLSFFIFSALIVFLTRSSNTEVSEIDAQKFAEFFPTDRVVQAVVFSSPT